MRTHFPLLAALAIVAGLVCPALAVPLTDDTIPPESLVALSVSGAALSFEAGRGLPAVPPASILPAPALAEDSLLLSEEGAEAEGGSAVPPAREPDLEEALRIDAGVAPAPPLAPVGGPGEAAAH
jgi:hypothetical protein